MRLNPKLSALLALLVVPLAAAPAGAVSGGTTLPIEQAPYVAWLGGRCTGTLISPTRILTAGHCLDGHSATDEVLLVGVDGNLLSEKQRRAQAIPVAGYSVDRKFKESFPFAHDDPSNAIAVDDVGLILLKKPLTSVKPVRLAGAGDGALEAPGVPATLIGYGETVPELAINPTPPPPHGLQQGMMPVIAPGACAQAYPHAIQPSMGCSQDLTPHAPLIQACAGDSGGPVVAQAPDGPVQIGVTSWGPETMDGACGEKPLPDVYMRTAAFTAFITEKKPVIEPFTLRRTPSGSLGFASSRIVGTARVGRTVTCKADKLGGDPYTLSYSWSEERGTGIVDIAGAKRSTLKVTSAIYRHALKQSRRLFCTATARNAGGSLPMSSGSVTLKK